MPRGRPGCPSSAGAGVCPVAVDQAAEAFSPELRCGVPWGRTPETSPALRLWRTREPMTPLPGSHAHPVTRALFRLWDPEEFSHAVSGATLRTEFLRRPEAPARIERFVGGDWAMDHFRAGVKARLCGPLLPDSISVCLVLQSGGSRWYGLEACAGMLLCNPPGVSIEGSFDPGFRGVSFAIRRSVWEECRRLAGAEPGAREEFFTVRLSHSAARTFGAVLPGVLDGLRHARPVSENGVTPAERGAWLTRAIALAAWEGNEQRHVASGSVKNRFRLARRAEAWMRERLHEPHGVRALCLAVGVSRRELEYAFRSAFDISPRDYFEALRLNAAHAALRRAGDRSVTDIALGHGFAHLGRFSRLYRARFGKHPSHVRRRG